MQRYLWLILITTLLAGCAPAAQQVLPTERPTLTPTLTATATQPPPSEGFSTPTLTRTRPPATSTGGPSPTALLGATRTPDRATTATPVRSINAPRIEFFTSDAPAVAPGSALSLFWSTRGADAATIYRLDPQGQRNQLWNVPPDGSLTVNTRADERGTVDFLLTVGEGNDRTEQRLSLPLSCPVAWFFTPPPPDCPDAEPTETRIVEQAFVRGRMLYVEGEDRIYVLFNDGLDPAWSRFQNLYNPAIHPESLEGFPVPAGRYQPLAILGYVWRGSDIVRSRLGLALEPEFASTGFTQTIQRGDAVQVYISGSDGNVLLLQPEGVTWELIPLG
ncbi:MAG: hypothetical protein ACOYL5_14135 [Phototrophicaceae bacterium]